MSRLVIFTGRWRSDQECPRVTVSFFDLFCRGALPSTSLKRHVCHRRSVFAGLVASNGRHGETAPHGTAVFDRQQPGDRGPSPSDGKRALTIELIEAALRRPLRADGGAPPETQIANCLKAPIAGYLCQWLFFGCFIAHTPSVLLGLSKSVLWCRRWISRGRGLPGARFGQGSESRRKRSAELSCFLMWFDHLHHSCRFR